MAKKSATATAKRVSTPPPGFGLRLSGAALTALHKVGIRAQQNVSLIHQRQTRQWVLRGEESGGAVPDLGHYVGFVGKDTESLLWSQRVQTIVPNSIHRFLIAPVLIRYEMYRFCSTYDLLISLHWVEAQKGNSRPTHQRKDLFVGHFGQLDTQLWTGAGAPLRGSVKPQFFGRSGEEIEIPEVLHDGIYRITEAACASTANTLIFWMH